MALKLAGFLAGVLLVVLFNVLIGVSSQTVQLGNGSALYKYSDTNVNTIPKFDEAVQKDLSPPIRFLGNYYSTIWISPYGFISFGKEFKYSSNTNFTTGIANPDGDIPLIAPLYYDTYKAQSSLSDPNNYQGKITYQITDFSKLGTNPLDQEPKKKLETYLQSAVLNSRNVTLTYLFVVTWTNVTDSSFTKECTSADYCNSATFQLVLAGNNINTYAIFNYDKFEMEIKAVNNYQAGFNVGQGGGWYNVLPCRGGCRKYVGNSEITNLAIYQGSDQRGRYIYSLGSETVIRGGCLDSRLTKGILEFYPRYVSMFGGELLEVSGICSTTQYEQNLPIYCQFGDSPPVTGWRNNSMKGYCPVPLLYQAGYMDVTFSTSLFHSADKVNQTISVVLPSRLKDPVEIDQATKDAWYKRDSSHITVKWDPNKFIRDQQVDVNVTIIGYRELSNKVEYVALKSVGIVNNNRGTYTFNVAENRCTENCDQYEIGLLEVSLSNMHNHLATERLAIRYGPIPLGWYVNQELSRQSGSDWSDKKCQEWSKSDAKDNKWLNDLLPCPCNLDQAIADFGQWQADPGCNMFAGSLCYFHEKAKHCVRSVAPSPKAAGNQCCYKEDGTLMYSQLSDHGSTPDRSHAWGKSPYGSPGTVPELSHWKQDVITFYYCCLWNKYSLCDLYTSQRPTIDCQRYSVPSFGFVFGQSHIQTWDGLSYNLIGYGDFFLVKVAGSTEDIQGKFGSLANSWDIGKLYNNIQMKPKALTGLVISNRRITIEITAPSGDVAAKRGIDLRINKEFKFFLDDCSYWQEYPEFTIINNDYGTQGGHNNFTIIFTKYSVGVNVAALNGLLHVAVTVSPDLKKKPGSIYQLTGLMGTYDGNSTNDFTTNDSKIISVSESWERILHDFGLSWRITNGSKFRHHTVPPDSLENKYFTYDQIPHNFTTAPDQNTIDAVCKNDTICQWDYRISGNRTIAEASKKANEWISNLVRSATQVYSCGFPEVGANTIVSSENFSVNSVVKVTGCRKNRNLDNTNTYRCVNETVESAKQNGRNDYGVTSTYNNVNYSLHWVPKPQRACSADVSVSESSDLGLIIGLSVGAVVLVIIIIGVVIFIIKKKKGSQSASVSKSPKSAAKDRREVIRDPAAADALMSIERDEGRVTITNEGPASFSKNKHDGSSV